MCDQKIKNLNKKSIFGNFIGKFNSSFKGRIKEPEEEDKEGPDPSQRRAKKFHPN